MSWVLYATAISLGLIAGSFLNVVIHRGPAMWGLVEGDRGGRGTLVAPRSYCPACKSQIAIADLMPIASYCILRGKCRTCSASISMRYPIIEFAGAAAAALSLAAFGLEWSALFVWVYLLALIALAAIDAETGYLPDAITLPLVALGLAVNAVGLFVPLADAIIGASAGYASFAAIAFLFRRLRGREGLGGGDAKLLAATGAWGGWLLLAPVIFVAALLALACIGAARFTGRSFPAEAPIPFGPALCATAAGMFLATSFGLLPVDLP